MRLLGAARNTFMFYGIFNTARLTAKYKMSICKSANFGKQTMHDNYRRSNDVH